MPALGRCFRATLCLACARTIRRKSQRGSTSAMPGRRKYNPTIGDGAQGSDSDRRVYKTALDNYSLIRDICGWKVKKGCFVHWFLVVHGVSFLVCLFHPSVYLARTCKQCTHQISITVIKMITAARQSSLGRTPSAAHTCCTAD